MGNLAKAANFSSKNEYRKEAKEKIASLSIVAKETATDKIHTNLAKYLSQHSLQRLASFQAMHDEVAIRPSLFSNLEFLYPRIEGESMIFYKAKSFVKNDRFGFLEPDLSEAEKVDKSEIDAFLVPGLCFDRQGNRLGRGKGYYDRYLASAKGIKIAISFAASLSDEILPVEKNDIKMNVIINENEIIEVNNG